MSRRNPNDVQIDYEGTSVTLSLAQFREFLMKGVRIFPKVVHGAEQVEHRNLHDASVYRKHGQRGPRTEAVRQYDNSLKPCPFPTCGRKMKPRGWPGHFAAYHPISYADFAAKYPHLVDAAKGNVLLIGDGKDIK